MNAPKIPEIRRVLASDEGFEWDVLIEPDPARYDGKMILRMVKLVNRRGRVRYFERWTDGKEFRLTASPDDIKEVDDLEAQIEDAVSGKRRGNALIISFEDKSDARALAREIARLVVPPELVEQMKLEADRRQRIADRHIRTDYPEPVRFARKEGSGELRGYKWLTMVAASSQSSTEVDDWMRRHIKGRYWAALWHPGETPILAKMLWRYWRLTCDQWQSLIEKSGEDGSFLIVCFHNPVDYNAFDARFGPGQLLGRSPSL